MKTARESITVRLNYRHKCKDNTYQVLFEIRNYTPKPFRANALNSKREIIRIRKDQINKGVIKNYAIDNYLQRAINRIRLVIDFLRFFNIDITKQNLEKYTWWEFSKVYEFFETQGDEDLVKAFIKNTFIKSEAWHKAEDRISIRDHFNLDLYKPQGILEAIDLYNFEGITRHKLEPFLRSYCNANNMNDILISTLNSVLFDKIVTFLCENPVAQGGKYYSIQTVRGFIKHLKIFCKRLQDKEYTIDTSVYSLNLKIGTRSDSHVSFDYNETENVIAINKAELDAIKAGKYTIKLSKNEYETLEKTRKLFLLQTLSGGLRISELKLITNDSFYFLNGVAYLNLPSPKTRKTIDNPMNVELQELLEKINYDVQSLVYFNVDTTYNNNLKKMAALLGLVREVPLKISKVDQSFAKVEVKKLCEVISSKFARKGFVTLLFYKGYTIEQISAFTGHSSDSIKNYIAVLTGEKEKTANTL